MSARVSLGHVVWAYADHIYDWSREGLTAAQIRDALREECSLHVGVQTVKAVLATYPARSPSRTEREEG